MIIDFSKQKGISTKNKGLSSRAKWNEVEGSTHFVNMIGKISARILRLATLAQDDSTEFSYYAVRA